MNTLLLRNLGVRKSSSLQTFTQYKQAEAQGTQRDSSVTPDGVILEYETLELRLHPPNVVVDNESYPDRTIITVDSANRPGTLVEVVQCLTELGLSIRRARISSDGGWFVDEFHVSETPSGRVASAKKLDAIKKVLNVGVEDVKSEEKDMSTVFQLSGEDKPGALADITNLLMHNGCEVKTAAVWTSGGKAACVLGVTDRSLPIKDEMKLNRLQQILYNLISGKGRAHVSVETVDGPIHHERRLHQLLLEGENIKRKELWQARCDEEELAMQITEAENRTADGQPEQSQDNGGWKSPYRTSVRNLKLPESKLRSFSPINRVENAFIRGPDTDWAQHPSSPTGKHDAGIRQAPKVWDSAASRPIMMPPRPASTNSLSISLSGSPAGMGYQYPQSKSSVPEVQVSVGFDRGFKYG